LDPTAEPNPGCKSRIGQYCKQRTCRPLVDFVNWIGEKCGDKCGGKFGCKIDRNEPCCSKPKAEKID